MPLLRKNISCPHASADGAASRRQAAFAVARWLATREFAAKLLPDGEDRAFVQDIVFTVVRRLRALRKVLGAFVPKWPKGELEALLYVGAAQILYMDDVPDFAAVSATVEAAKFCENPSIARVVNGTLRNLTRRRAEIAALLAAEPPEVRESFPSALYARWRERFGEDGAARLAAWHNQPAQTFIARADGTFAPLARGMRVDALPGYAQGEFIVQDPATALAVAAIDPRQGETILDACAAPGGKTIQMAWRGARVTACEVNPKRARTLAANLKRTRLENAVVTIAELPQAETLFDKVLVDAPCSNTGVIRRRPDVRWNWSVEKLAALVRMQADILDAAARRVAPGGLLVYSTCSIEPEENSAQVAAFLRRNPAFSLLKESESIPFQSGMDGAYAAALRRDAARQDATCRRRAAKLSFSCSGTENPGECPNLACTSRWTGVALEIVRESGMNDVERAACEGFGDRAGIETKKKDYFVEMEAKSMLARRVPTARSV